MITKPPAGAATSCIDEPAAPTPIATLTPTGWPAVSKRRAQNSGTLPLASSVTCDQASMKLPSSQCTSFGAAT